MEPPRRHRSSEPEFAKAVAVAAFSVRGIVASNGADWNCVDAGGLPWNVAKKGFALSRQSAAHGNCEEALHALPAVPVRVRVR